MLKALKHGQSLSNVDLWKFLQLLINIIGIWLPVLALINPQAKELLDTGFVAEITTAFAATNAYLTLATSPKIGV